MIIVRSPFRFSLFGGGTDIPKYFTQEPGAVFSFTINKYVYIMLNNSWSNKFRVSYSVTENVDDYSELKHDIVRNCLELVGFDHQHGVEVVMSSDVSMRGSGLGASSSLTVGILRGFLGPDYQDLDIANLAAYIEIDRCGKPIGFQDQVAAAFGGLNYITFGHGDVLFAVSRLSAEVPDVYEQNLNKMCENILVFYVGERQESADFILSESSEPDKFVIRDLANLAKKAYGDFKVGDFSDFGRMLEENWKLKQVLTPRANNDMITGIINTAATAGATGFKCLGAGAGGCILCWADPDRHEAIKEAVGLRVFDWKPEINGLTGARVLYGKQ